MKNYKVYGNEQTNLKLTAKAEKAYCGCDYRIHELYNGTYEIWLDNHAEATGLTAQGVSEWFEDMAEIWEEN